HGRAAGADRVPAGPAHDHEHLCQHGPQRLTGAPERAPIGHGPGAPVLAGVAEGVGFEPTGLVTLRFSRPLPSAARPPFRAVIVPRAGFPCLPAPHLHLPPPPASGNRRRPPGAMLALTIPGGRGGR